MLSLTRVLNRIWIFAYPSVALPNVNFWQAFPLKAVADLCNLQYSAVMVDEKFVRNCIPGPWNVSQLRIVALISSNNTWHLEQGSGVGVYSATGKTFKG